ncbi:hypothetical protein IMG5_171260 [Ichthyophthirius multifiliis]|uniref:Uncharacterized protein n=1 Tax=Ichthyophthirius multifiliis TaxID=5932 RepID=G0R1L4_ICHMU|nr:hypothetical protein IMG5_171260 [Ichthyophthirius multifiliis]EGR28643.1 hypothetical protein IMG5_171260 [Ichthyophthirius multifiliis]|eukprot:XP_004029879.1 hypothetical protein IMG5_171260 [Ichthyophthirius multifiliis]
MTNSYKTLMTKMKLKTSYKLIIINKQNYKNQLHLFQHQEEPQQLERIQQISLMQTQQIKFNKIISQIMHRKKLCNQKNKQIRKINKRESLFLVYKQTFKLKKMILNNNQMTLQCLR